MKPANPGRGVRGLVRRLFLLLMLAGLGLWLWKFLFPSPEKVIRKQLAQVARAASFTAKEGPLVRANQAARLARHFSVDAQVNLEAPGRGSQTFSGRNEIQQAALAARSVVETLTVEFLDIVVMLDPDKLSATVDLVVKARVSGERDFYVQEMKFVLRKINGDWRIVQAETVKTLSHGPPRRHGEVRTGRA